MHKYNPNQFRQIFKNLCSSQPPEHLDLGTILGLPRKSQNSGGPSNEKHEPDPFNDEHMHLLDGTSAYSPCPLRYSNTPSCRNCLRCSDVRLTACLTTSMLVSRRSAALVTAPGQSSVELPQRNANPWSCLEHLCECSRSLCNAPAADEMGSGLPFTALM